MFTELTYDNYTYLYVHYHLAIVSFLQEFKIVSFVVHTVQYNILNMRVPVQSSYYRGITYIISFILKITRFYENFYFIW